jgi:dTDP-4-amino-4,6-dideoxygalactose transaminase
MINTTFSPWPLYSDEEIAKVTDILRSNKVNYWTGSECRNFEKEFAEFTNTKHAIALSNGTVALDLALKAAEIGHGDEVLVTSRTFIASASSIVNSGAKPIFVDICPNSQNFRSTEILKKISPKTKAIICVHLAGWPCEMEKIMDIANKYNIYVIEDCAQAHGAKYRGAPLGSIGHIGCWSFCQDKIMTTAGEGGMVTTNSNKLWKKMWSFKDHGKSYAAVYKKSHPPGFRWLHESFGTNWRMTEIQGAIGRIQLRKMPEWNKVRNKYQNTIWDTAKKYKSLRVPMFNLKDWDFYHPENVHGAYKCYIFVNQNALKPGWTRDRIIDEVNKMGVPCFSGSCSEVYLEKAFKNKNLEPKQRLQHAKELGETSLMFLIHPSLTKNEIKKTCNSLDDVIQRAEL